MAKNWAGVLAAILALLGVGTLIGSASTVEAYSTIWKVAFGIVDLVALLAAVAVLYQSNLATFGSPRIKDALRPSDLANSTDNASTARWLDPRNAADRLT